MAGYTEDNAVFPFTYADASYRLTTAYVGASYHKALVAQADLVAQRGTRTGSFRPRPRVIATAEHIGKLNMDSFHTHPRTPVLHRVLCAEPQVPHRHHALRRTHRNPETDFGVTVGISGRF